MSNPLPMSSCAPRAGHGPCAPWSPSAVQNVPTDGINDGNVYINTHMRRMLTALRQIDVTPRVTNVGNQLTNITNAENEATTGQKILRSTYNNLITITDAMKTKYCACVTNACNCHTVTWCNCQSHHVCNCQTHHVCNCQSRCACNTQW